MKKIQIQKTLNLRTLTVRQLAGVPGGFIAEEHSDSCATGLCTTIRPWPPAPPPPNPK